MNDPRYEDYGLRKPVRDHVAHRMQGNAVFSASASSYYDHLLTLFRQIDEGDESIGLPPYNGGLFASEVAPLLKAARLTDKIVGDIIYDLSHTETEGTRHFVNYRDMSVQQLGSIYERLLEREPVRDDKGEFFEFTKVLDVSMNLCPNRALSLRLYKLLIPATPGSLWCSSSPNSDC